MGPGLLGRPGGKADFWLPGFGFGFGFGLPAGLGAAGAGSGAGSRGRRGEEGGLGPCGAPREVLGGAGPKAEHVDTSDLKYGTSPRELEGVGSVVAANVADALSPSTGWRPSVAAPIESLQKVEIVTLGSLARASSCLARTSFACEMCGMDVSHEGGVVLVSMWSKRSVLTSMGL